MTPPFRVESLGPGHDRSSFRCGEQALDRYLRTQAGQDSRRRISNCFVVVESASGTIAAYYTLSSASIPMVDLPEEESRKLPRYPVVPAVRIGRLAVDERFRGRGLGAGILVDAAARVTAADAASYMLLVDAKDERAAAFYMHFGFRPLVTRPLTLYLPLATAMLSLRK